jgi:hypothetical protein
MDQGRQDTMTTTYSRPLSARKAQTIIDGARLEKAPDWRESHHWHVVAEDGTLLVVVLPSYGGISQSGRNGWRMFVAEHGPSGDRRRWATRQDAAARGLMAWRNWVTSR